jgi:hypothetical protein
MLNDPDKYATATPCDRDGHLRRVVTYADDMYEEWECHSCGEEGVEILDAEQINAMLADMGHPVEL